MILENLKKLKPVVLLTTGRTGSDFLQSLLDSHDEILTFNGHFDYYQFWKRSKCVNSKIFSEIDFADEFIGHHIEKFKTKYDIIERKDKLGVSFNQSINIDLLSFKKCFSKILQGQKLNSSNCLLSIYGAYNLSLGQDLNKKKVFFHHIHHIDRLDSFLEDFPESKIISMSRDPRANMVSGYRNHKKNNPEAMYGSHQFFYIKRIFEDSNILRKYNQKYISLKIEDLGSEKIIRKLADWLDIKYSEVLYSSTWGGLTWHGDKLSGENKTQGKFSKKILKNDWKNYLSKKDQYIFNFLMYDRLKEYGYYHEEKSHLSYFLVPFLVMFPLTYEKEMFSIHFIFDKIKKGNGLLVFKNIVCYFKRVLLFESYYFQKKNKPKYNILN
jgi:hypothetical protein